MLSLTSNPSKPTTTTSIHSPFLSSPLHSHSHLKPITKHHHKKHLISSTFSPQPPSPKPPKTQPLYQPFRQPTSQTPIPPQYQNLDNETRLEILTNRLGQWFEYATLIPHLVSSGYTPETIEQRTAIYIIEQNQLIVASQVRQSLVDANVDPETLEYFDKGGPELLYEIRTVGLTLRPAVAVYLCENKLEPENAEELSRAIKDYPKRRGEPGWESFDYNIPGDCLAFMYFRQAVEVREMEMREIALQKAFDVAVSEDAKACVFKEMSSV